MRGAGRLESSTAYVCTSGDCVLLFICIGTDTYSFHIWRISCRISGCALCMCLCIVMIFISRAVCAVPHRTDIYTMAPKVQKDLYQQGDPNVPVSQRPKQEIQFWILLSEMRKSIQNLKSKSRRLKYKLRLCNHVKLPNLEKTWSKKHRQSEQLRLRILINIPVLVKLIQRRRRTDESPKFYTRCFQLLIEERQLVA